jgi:hypothetical protein
VFQYRFGSGREINAGIHENNNEKGSNKPPMHERTGSCYPLLTVCIPSLRVCAISWLLLKTKQDLQNPVGFIFFHREVITGLVLPFGEVDRHHWEKEYPI